MRSPEEYKTLLTEVIKKQIAILGSDITLTKARNVPGLTISNDGAVTDFSGDPAQVTQKLVDQFMELSGLIVKKTMEPLLSSTQPVPNQSQNPQSPPITPISQPQPPQSPLPSDPNPTPPNLPNSPTPSIPSTPSAQQEPAPALPNVPENSS